MKKLRSTGKKRIREDALRRAVNGKRKSGVDGATGAADQKKLRRSSSLPASALFRITELSL